MSKKAIEHRGVITAIEAKTVKVEIQVESACGGCEAQGTCMSKDSKSREISINNVQGNFSLGQFVTVVGEGKGGLKAVLLAYFIPFLLVLITLITSLELTQGNEVKSGMLSLAILLPYYTVLWLLKDRLTQSFRFKIRD